VILVIFYKYGKNRKVAKMKIRKKLTLFRPKAPRKELLPAKAKADGNEREREAVKGK
jgi:hypothetical protein